MQGKISAALKFLDKESCPGLHTLSEEILKELKQKHPLAAKAEDTTLLHGPIVDLAPYTFEMITEQEIMKSAMRTKGRII